MEEMKLSRSSSDDDNDYIVTKTTIQNEEIELDYSSNDSTSSSQATLNETTYLFSTSEENKYIFKPNMLQLIGRWLSRESFFEKLALSVATDKNISSFPGLAKKVRPYLLYMLNAAGTPQNQQKHILRAFIITSFFQGAGLITDILWPLAFTGLLSHDIIIYGTKPDDRYQTQLWQILLGTAANQSSISCHLGSNLPTAINYWLWPSLILASAFLAGVGRGVIQKNWLKAIAQNSYQQDEEEFSLNNDKPQHLFNLMANPNNKSAWWSVLRVNFAVNWDNRLQENDRKILFPTYGGPEQQRGIAGYIGLKTLAAMADSFDARNQKFMPKANQSALMARGQESLNKLTTIANSPKEQGIFRYVYAQYLLWSLGQRCHIAFQPIFWTFSLYLFYTKLRWWELWIYKIVQFIDYLFKLKECHDEEKIYSYIQEFGDYFCSVCGDWPFVYVGDIFTSQSCLNGLLVQPRTPEFILSHLPRVIAHPTFNKVDLSQQPWQEWTLPQYQEFFQQISSVMSRLQTLNLSSVVYNNNQVDDQKINQLGKFISHLQLTTLDLTNQNIGPTLIKSLMSANYSNLTFLKLTKTNLNDEGIIYLSQHLPINLSYLSIAENNLTDFGLQQASININNSIITTLNLSGNQLTGASFSALAPLLQNQGIEILDISNNNYSEANFTILWQATTLQSNSSLFAINLSNTQITDAGVLPTRSWLPNSTLQYINCQNNALTDIGIAAIFEGLSNSSVTAIDLSSNAITDAGLSFIASTLSSTKIITLGLSRASFTDQGINVLANVIPQTKMQVIKLAGNGLTQQAVLNLSQMLPNSTIQSLDLSDNQLSDEAVKILITTLTSCHIQELQLANNALSEPTLIKLANSLPQTKLKRLNLENNQITDLTTFVQALPFSQLQEINLYGNSLTISSLNLLFENLIRNIAHKESLINDEIPRDLAIALNTIAQPNTALKKINIGDTTLEDDSARIGCRALKAANISFANIVFLPNSLVNQNRINLNNCRFDQESSSFTPYINPTKKDKMLFSFLPDITASVAPQNISVTASTNLSIVTENKAVLPDTVSAGAMGGSMFFMLACGGFIIMAFFAFLYLFYMLIPNTKKQQWFGMTETNFGISFFSPIQKKVKDQEKKLIRIESEQVIKNKNSFYNNNIF